MYYITYIYIHGISTNQKSVHKVTMQRYGKSRARATIHHEKTSATPEQHTEDRLGCGIYPQMAKDYAYLHIHVYGCFHKWGTSKIDG